MKTYQKTIAACFVGYCVQAIINNFVPLLFLTFQSEFQISLSKITLLVTINFGLQLLIDLLSAAFLDKIGYRTAALLAHGLSAAGLILLIVLPQMFSNPFTGIVIAVMIYAVGGGLLEVIVSPIVEACPTEHKEKTMSLLHSFYCWGHVGVVLLSTLFFQCFGISNWRILAALWTLIPIGNAFLFAKVPLAPLAAEGEQGFTIKELIQKKQFWLFMLLMLCAGACEQAVSQWASTFAEQGLGVSKTVGDLAGPMMFAVMMGGARVFYGKYGEKIQLERFMQYSGILCVTAYLIISLSPNAVFGLVGCGLCGLSVGILWPGTFSIAAKTIRGGGTALFAFLALAGDLGCLGGPTVVGLVSGIWDDNLKAGIFAAILFPLVLLGGLFIYRNWKQTENK